MKKHQKQPTDQKGGLIPLDRHSKLTEKQDKAKHKGGGRGGAPGHWS